MSSSDVETDARVHDVTVSDDELTVWLVDGRRVTVPLSWFPRLASGSARARANWELVGDGQGVHWPDLDEDLSVAGLLRGSRAPGSMAGG